MKKYRYKTSKYDDTKFTFYDKMYNIFEQYRMSINWKSTIFILLLINLALILDGNWSIPKSLMMSGAIFIITLCVWGIQINKRT